MGKHPLPGLLLLVSLASVGMLVYTPALPAIEHFFGLRTHQSEIIVGAALLGYALGQLPYGPLTNRFGDRLTLATGITFTIAGSLLAALTFFWNWYPLLLIGVFIASFGAAAGLKLTYHTIPSIYSPTERRRIAAYVIGSFSVTPYLSLLIGGILSQYLGWPTCFLFFVLYTGAVLLVAIYSLKPSGERIWNCLDVRKIAHSFAHELRSPLVVVSALLWGLSTAPLYLFAAHAPYIGIVQLGLTPTLYGLWTLIPAAGLLIGSLIASQLVKRLSASMGLAVGVVLTSAGAIGMFVPFAMGVVNLASLFFPPIAIYAGVGFVTSNASVTGVSHSTDRSTATSAMAFINIGLAFVAVAILDAIPTKLPTILPIFFLAIAIAMIVLAWPFALLLKREEQT